MRKREQPRFASENLDQNVELFRRLSELAFQKGCTPGQLALAWLHHQGEDVAPIPGTTKRENLEENIGAFDVKLSNEELQALEAIFVYNCATGNRYGDMKSTTIDSETVPFSEWQDAV
eukprot:c22132_g1_i4 orf=642-995(+)